MKHSSSQILWAHWNTVRAGEPAPERRDIDPGALRGALADVFILSYDAKAGHSFRLAGTKACALFCRELRGAGFLDLWASEERAEISRLLAITAQESVGIVAAVTGNADYQATLDLELTLFPLLHHGRTHGRLVGSLAPLRAPYWLGLHPLKSLTLGRYRYLGPTLNAPAPKLTPRPSAATFEPLRVYQGGKG